MKRSIFFILLTFVSLGHFTASAQKKKKHKKEEVEQVTETKKKEEPKKKDPLSYDDFMDSTVVKMQGLHTVYLKDKKWYFEVSDTLFNREIMSITRFLQTAAGGGIYGGELVNKQVVKWEKAPNDQLFLRSVSLVVSSPDSTQPIAKAVKNSNADPIIGAFKIKALHVDSVNNRTGYIIDVTSYFEGEEQAFSLDPSFKTKYKITSLKSDRSYIDEISTFPINTEVKTVKTFAVNNQKSPQPGSGEVLLQAAKDVGVITMSFNTSMLLLPEVPMKKRLFDPRVGYFANQYEVYEENSQLAETEIFAVRWRLEPKSNEDLERQKKGELIEPAKPIVYYVDPATPEKWKPYIKEGINDWNVAFENAGWKNAIRGEYWPEDDTTMSLEDARYSVVRYFASPIANAYGPNVHDPRSGEILESHIGWYHNVMKLLRNWYMIQAAAVDPRARAITFEDSLMGSLIRFVSSHEVGHTLGLRHNMGASSATPVEKLRDDKWLAANGHTSSIMDYARFNYVAQPEDSVTHLFPGIGAYDKWAIKWGYAFIDSSTSPKAEQLILNEWTKEAYKQANLRFGTEISPYDPRYQTEDLGDNAMKASAYGIRNLKLILPQLEQWVSEDAKTYTDLRDMHKELVGQFRRYMGHVTKNIGGIYDVPKTYDMEGVQFEVVPAATQREAIEFLNKQLFNAPDWLFPNTIMDKIKIETGVEAVKQLQTTYINALLDADRLIRLHETSILNSQNFSVEDLLESLEKAILKSINNKVKSSVYERNLQKVYVEKLIELLTEDKAELRTVALGIPYGYDVSNVKLSETDIPSIAYGHLRKIQNKLSISANNTDDLTQFHNQYLHQRIKNILENNK